MSTVAIGGTIGHFMSQANVYAFGSKDAAIVSFSSECGDVILVCVCIEYPYLLYSEWIFSVSQKHECMGNI